MGQGSCPACSELAPQTHVTIPAHHVSIFRSAHCQSHLRTGLQPTPPPFPKSPLETHPHSPRRMPDCHPMSRTHTPDTSATHTIYTARIPPPFTQEDARLPSDATHLDTSATHSIYIATIPRHMPLRLCQRYHSLPPPVPASSICIPRPSSPVDHIP